MADIWSDAASWVQAVGTIAAVGGAAWIAAGDARAARRREEMNRLEAMEREERTVLSSRTAAQNLAILAATQIHELHLLAKDETRRTRISRVSPSRAVATTERMLTAFPIELLGDADAMVAFSFFPGALTTAGEIYANLEAAVRATADGQQADVFADYTRQISRLDRAAQERLGALRLALGLPVPRSDPRPAP